MSEKSEAEHYLRGFIAGLNDAAGLVKRLAAGTKEGLLPGFIEAGNTPATAEAMASMFRDSFLSVADSIQTKMQIAHAMLDNTKAGKPHA